MVLIHLFSGSDMCENNENGNDISNRINAVRDSIIEYLGKANANANGGDDLICRLRYINNFIESNDFFMIGDIAIVDNNLELYDKFSDVYCEFSAEHILTVRNPSECIFWCGKVKSVRLAIIDDIEKLEKLVLIIRDR